MSLPNVPAFDATLLTLLGCLLLVLLGLAGFLLLRRRAGGARESAAHELCKMLDHYLDSLTVPEARQFDADRLWARLEQARLIHRAHFRELYTEMLELAKVHGELTSVLLDGHMRRHGAPTTQWDNAEGQAQLEELQQRAASAVLQLKRRCRALAHLYADSQSPG